MQRYEFFSIFVLQKIMNMEQNVFQKNMWNLAAKAGLVLGLVSASYLFITHMITKAELSAIITTPAGIVLWLGKFGGCILLMRYFMKKLAAENTSVDNASTFRFGMIVSILSAIVFAAYTFADVAFISAYTYSEQMNQVMQTYTQFLDSNSMAQIEKMIDKMPQITFFSNLVYCFLYGTVLSFILSRSIPSKDPFAEFKPEEQN